MEILVLGGTAFLSAAIATDALQRGHMVTCLARGTPGPVPNGARLVRSDRSCGLEAYREVDTSWDAVVDVTSEPTFAREALAALGSAARHWTYVSSCSVYADQNMPNADESALTVEPLRSDGIASPASYAAAKAACEAACQESVGDVLHLCRPGLIGGPGDQSDRFGYWPARFAAPSHRPVLVPDQPDGVTQTIDVRDLARWIIFSAEHALTGTFNAVGETALLNDVLSLACEAAGYRGELIPVDPQWLTERGVAPWSGDHSLPLWIPNGSGLDGFARRSCTRALAAGLQRRPLPDTMTATLTYERQQGLDRVRRAGLEADFEAELLTEWAQTSP